MKLIDKINALSEKTKWEITIGVAALALITIILCAIGGAFHFEAIPIAAQETEAPETTAPKDEDDKKNRDKDEVKDEEDEEPDGTIHTVFISCGSGGTADPSGSIKVRDWDKLTLTFTPNEGYEIESVTVDGADVGAVEEYTLDYIIGDHSVVVSFAEIVESTPEPTVEPSDTPDEYTEN